ncbi:MAG: response regulator [Microcoleaceae cyanobacterium]
MKRIMVVDNEPDTQYLFSKKFKKEIKAGQIEFVSAVSAKEALSYLELSKNQIINLVISDINLPVINGLELQRVLFFDLIK